MHYYQFNIADYRKDTQHLTPIEHYIYRELIDWYYLDESPIPKKTQLVLRRLRLVSENNQDLVNILNEFFIEAENCWFHRRIDAEITKYQAKADVARANGSKGGRPKKPRKTKPVILANPEITGSKANYKPITNNHKPIKERGAKRFTPPSLDEIMEYCVERKNTINPQTFMDFYQAKGWMVGKNKMKDWKACVRTWEQRPGDKNGSYNQTSRQSAQQNAGTAHEKAMARVVDGGLYGEDALDIP